MIDHDLQREVEELRRTMQRQPIWTPGSDVLAMLEILHGADVGSGLIGIAYAPTVASALLYDAEVDTDFIAGLGSAYLWRPGVMTPTRVLVRHDNDAHIGPIMEGHRYYVAGTVIETVASGPDAGAALTCLRFAWPS